MLIAKQRTKICINLGNVMWSLQTLEDPDIIKMMLLIWHQVAVSYKNACVTKEDKMYKTCIRTILKLLEAPTSPNSNTTINAILTTELVKK